MGVLAEVLQFKANEQAQQKAQADSILQATQLFQQARQQAIANQVTGLQLKAGLAEKGLIIDPSSKSGFKRDTSLMSPLEQLIQTGQAADASNKIMAAGGPGINLFGGGQASIPTASIGGAIGSVIGQPSVGGTTSPGMIETQKLNVAGVPTDTSVTYPAAKAAEASATDLGKATAEAQKTSARDTAQLQMVSQGIKNMNEIHKELSDKGFAGNSLANAVLTNYQHLPNSKLQNAVVPQDVQKLSGRFTSARNETLVKVQPILSQQFGEAGSVRIMESLLNLSKGEFGDLSTPHAQFEGQAEGTLGSLYRIKLASDRYLQELKNSGQSIPKDEKSVIDGISSNMSDLSPAQEAQLKGLVDNTLGKSVQTFNVGGITYNIPADKVPEFKKAKGIK